MITAKQSSSESQQENFETDQTAIPVADVILLVPKQNFLFTKMGMRTPSFLIF